MASEISLASSKMITSRLPLLWAPAKACGLSSDQVLKSVRQVASCSASSTLIEVTCTSNQSLLMQQRNHFAISGCVLVFSWSPVFAVTSTLQSRQVDFAQCTILPMTADLPIPCPDEMPFRKRFNRDSAFCR